MSRPVTHIIHKLNLEIEVPDERLARRMYAQAGSLLQDRVLPELEVLLKRLDKQGLHIRLDRLDVDLNIEKGHVSEEVLRSRIAAAIAEKLEAISHSAGPANFQSAEARVSTTDNIVAAFLFFLEKGYLPWWVEEPSFFSKSQNIIDAIAVAEDRFIVVFRRLTGEKPLALFRLLQQYDRLMLTYLFSLMTTSEIFSLAVLQEAELEAIREPGYVAEGLLRQYWQRLWTLVPVSRMTLLSAELMKSKLKEIFSDLASLYNARDITGDNSHECFVTGDHSFQTTALLWQQDQDKWHHALMEAEAVARGTVGQVDDAAELYFGNAGLVILHPFLQLLFQELGLLEGDCFKNDRSRATAVHLLHYMATGKEQVPDFGLVFEKYLCGMHAGQVTDRYGQLSAKMKDEARSVLAAVLKHWEVLKRTTIEGLQEGFLQRKGKLMIRDNNHRIIIEPGAIDILLQQIPWNISLIKLPWRKELIYVEWMV